jgi:chromosome segregation ATPase
MNKLTYDELQKEFYSANRWANRLEEKVESLQKENAELKEKLLTFSDSDLKIKLDKAVSALNQINHHLSDIEHSNKRYSEVGKEDIALVKIMPAVDCIREALKEIGVE